MFLQLQAIFYPCVILILCLPSVLDVAITFGFSSVASLQMFVIVVMQAIMRQKKSHWNMSEANQKESPNQQFIKKKKKSGTHWSTATCLTTDIYSQRSSKKLHFEEIISD